MNDRENNTNYGGQMATGDGNVISGQNKVNWQGEPPQQDQPKQPPPQKQGAGNHTTNINYGGQMAIGKKNEISGTNQVTWQGYPAPQKQETIGVLFALSSPRGHEILRLNEEMRIIEQVMERSKYRDQIRRRVLHALTSNDLQHEMRTNTYQILHLAGHGFSEGFILETEQGHPYRVSRESLVAYLSNYRETLRCVVLNACYSLSLGESLSLGIPYVICVNGEIHDPAAIAFSTGFYDAIGAGYDIERAYSEGLGAMRLANLDHRLLVLLDRANGN